MEGHTPRSAAPHGVESPLSPGPMGYLVHQHANLVVAIKELREEVSSLLEFREAVSAALPHIHPSQQPTLTPYLHTTSGKDTTTAVPPSTPTTSTNPAGGAVSGGVSDSGFTDKNWCSGSMKTTSSSCTSNEGNEEDELLVLLDAIEKKGSKLQKELFVARSKLYETTSEGGGEDPDLGARQGYNADPLWPLSLPASSSPLVTSLITRASTAEGEAAEAKERLCDLHACLSLVLNEKRRLERELRYKGDEAGYSYPPMATHLSSPLHLHSYPNSAPQPPILPRVLKVPIKDKEKKHSFTRKKSDAKKKTEVEDHFLKDSSFKLPPNLSDFSPISRGRSRSMSTVKNSPSKNVSLRVEGTSLPPGIKVVDGKISVTPNRSKIASILREKNVLELQKQLLHTVMEAEVLRTQVTVIQEQLKDSKLSHHQSPARQLNFIKIPTKMSPKHIRDSKILETSEHTDDISDSKLTCDSSTNKSSLEGVSAIDTTDTCVNNLYKTSEEKNSEQSVCDDTTEVLGNETVDKVISDVSTKDSVNSDDLEPSYKVHRGPNVKYHVMVHEEKATESSTVNNAMRERLNPPVITSSESEVKERSLNELLSTMKNSKDKTIQSIFNNSKANKPSNSPAIVSSSSMVAKIVNSKISNPAARSQPPTTNYRRMTAAIEKPPRSRGNTLSSKFMATSRMDDQMRSTSPRDNQSTRPSVRPKSAAMNKLKQLQSTAKNSASVKISATSTLGVPKTTSKSTPSRLSTSPVVSTPKSTSSGSSRLSTSPIVSKSAPCTTFLKSPKQVTSSRSDRMTNLTKPTVASARKSNSFKSQKETSDLTRSHSAKLSSKATSDYGSNFSSKWNSNSKTGNPRVTPTPKICHSKSSNKLEEDSEFKVFESKSKDSGMKTKQSPKPIENTVAKKDKDEVPSFCTLSYSQGIDACSSDEEFYDSIGDLSAIKHENIPDRKLHHSLVPSRPESLAEKTSDAHHQSLPRWANARPIPGSDTSQAPSMFQSGKHSFCRGVNPLRAVTMNPLLSQALSPSPIDSLDADATKGRNVLETSVDSM